MFIGFYHGIGGMNSTVLTAPMTTTDTTAAVQSTGGFLAFDSITIGGETMSYTSKDLTDFKGLSRSDGIAHNIGDMVYNQQSSLLNNALDYNISTVSSSAGGYGILIVPIKFFTTTLPNLVSSDSIVQLLPGELSFVAYIWIAMTIGIVISLGIAMVWVASNLIGRLL
jgi:hypothetical protein